ncbi:hypothetical protein RB199_28050 [Streptomyces libani]
MLELRYGDGPAVRPDGLDWDLIRREHERLPLGKAPGHSGNYGSGLLQLTRWEGCPADLVRESFRHNAYQTAWQAADLPFEFLAEAAADDIPLSHVLKRGIGEGGLSPHRVLTELTPAADILRALPYDHEPTRKAVADLVAPLGADPVNWLTYYDRMRRFPRNSVAALVADVTDPGSRKKRCTSWPRPRNAQFPPGDTPEESRAAFLGMLECAPEEVQIAVVPSLDPLAVQQFLREGNPSPVVREAVVAAHGLPAQLAMAAGTVREEKLEYLLGLDEPAVDAKLFRDHFLDRSERARLLAGRLRGGGIRPVLRRTARRAGRLDHQPGPRQAAGRPGIRRSERGPPDPRQAAPLSSGRPAAAAERRVGARRAGRRTGDPGHEPPPGHPPPLDRETAGRPRRSGAAAGPARRGSGAGAAGGVSHQAGRPARYTTEPASQRGHGAALGGPGGGAPRRSALR